MSAAGKLRAHLSPATPRPWRVSMSGYSVKCDDPDVRMVATVPGGAKATDKELRAWLENSSLIVAAVNALPELVDVVEAAEALDLPLMDADQHEAVVPVAALARLRDALAKLEGAMKWT